MSLTKEVLRIEGYSPEQFKSSFLDAKKPVVFKDFMNDWPAKEKWNIDFFQSKYGKVMVPVYNDDYHKPGKNYMSSIMQIPFSEYLESIQKRPSSLRLFLFNILKNIPELKEDIPVPKFLKGIKTGIPFLFFGGQGAKVGLHYDIDMAHVFLSQFEGVKRVLLFDQQQSTALYKQPFTVQSYLDPDNLQELSKNYPAFKHANGYEILLQPGQTLFIPSGYWHFITYPDCSFSISMRAYSSISQIAKGVVNLATHFTVNKTMNTLLKNKWRDYKMSIAQKRAVRLLKSIKESSGLLEGR